jgi:hypothetical protein
MSLNLAPVFEWVQKREEIRIRRAAGLRPPWTDDPILSTYRFCNVRREDDTVTRWVRDRIRAPFADHPNLWFMLAIARQINWPDTLAELIATPGAWPDRNSFDIRNLEEAIAIRLARGDKTWTGAYVIAAGERGTKKHVHVTRNVLGPLYEDRMRFAAHFSQDPTIQSTHALLSSYNGWGPFMAYQACVDMRFTRLLSGAADVKTWAAAGPGTLRGLNRVYGRELKVKVSQAQALVEIAEVDAGLRAKMASDKNFVQIEDLDFSDIPNVMCEVDKFLRVRNGQGKPRTKYSADL